MVVVVVMSVVVVVVVETAVTAAEATAICTAVARSPAQRSPSAPEHLVSSSYPSFPPALPPSPV